MNVGTYKYRLLRYREPAQNQVASGGGWSELTPEWADAPPQAIEQAAKKLADPAGKYLALGSNGRWSAWTLGVRTAFDITAPEQAAEQVAEPPA